MDVFDLVQEIGKLLDLAGVVVMLVGIILSTVILVHDFFREKASDYLYRSYKKHLGKSILLALEFLVAGDILRSIVGDPSFAAIGVLALIVLIRSFLGITFDMEIEGRWPWQKREAK